MKAKQLVGYRQLQDVEIEAPVPQDGQALIRLQKVSICGSDLRFFSGSLPEEAYPLEPGRPGHECAGIVEESRCAEVTPGQRVIVHPREGFGLREYLVERPERIIPLPEEGDLGVLVMGQPMGTVLYSCSRMPNMVGKRVVVLGQGPIGLCFTQFLLKMGVRALIVSDLEEYRLEVARSFGPVATINASREDTVQAVHELTHGEGADVVVEAAGEEETVNQAFHVARFQGTVVFFGLTHQRTFPVDFLDFWDKQLTCLATSASRSGNIKWAVEKSIELFQHGRLDLAQLVTHRMPFEAAQEAFTLYDERRDGVVKVVMEL